MPILRNPSSLQTIRRGKPRLHISHNLPSKQLYYSLQHFRECRTRLFRLSQPPAHSERAVETGLAPSSRQTMRRGKPRLHISHKIPLVPRLGTVCTTAWYCLYHGLVLLVPRLGISRGTPPLQPRCALGGVAHAADCGRRRLAPGPRKNRNFAQNWLCIQSCLKVKPHI